ncbi:hypothetical protein J2Y69_000528 [Microbacterium resistens]|uniref:Uncharacterized protein n=1 Tax=Microbacterium resistens TaxID=156977 RepID=A0ABU1SAJ3_9MICO|nr:hypothetical protein [Microbacterium resistens]MDR6865943.1 hypothetical protein [Microbacterium resistens]
MEGIAARRREPAPIGLAATALGAGIAGAFLLSAQGDAVLMGRLLLTTIGPLLSFAAAAPAFLAHRTTVAASLCTLGCGAMAIVLNGLAIDAWYQMVDERAPLAPPWVLFVLACVVAGLAALAAWPQSRFIAFALSLPAAAAVFLIIAIPFTSIGLAALALSMTLLGKPHRRARGYPLA